MQGGVGSLTSLNSQVDLYKSDELYVYFYLYNYRRGDIHLFCHFGIGTLSGWHIIQKQSCFLSKTTYFTLNFIVYSNVYE